ncbi:MAG TPA: TolC family protein [Gemmatimonadales bacterium]|nr:TolC family protein [Gemmatimonadales bacterium]
MYRWTTIALLTVLPVAGLSAQNQATPAQTTGPLSLSLEEALSIAKANSPLYAQSLSTADPAKWGVRAAYGGLLPAVGVSGGMGYTGSGSTNLGGGAIIPTSPQIGSNYNLGITYNLNGQTIFAPGQNKATKRATEQEIAGTETNLVADVTTQYLTVKQADAQVAVQIQQVDRNKIFLDLANAKMKVGQGTLLEVKQAEVSLGQAQVELLRRQQTSSEAKLELFRRMGISAPSALNLLTLTDSFPVVEFNPGVDTILDLAAKQNPDLQALREHQRSAQFALKAAKSEYFPTLFAQAGWSGYTQQFTDESLLISQQLSGAQGTAANCNFQNGVINGLTYGPGGIPGQPNGGLIADCNAFAGLNPGGTALDPAVQQSLIDNNRTFPFHFTSQPFQASLTISLPIFNGFSRELRVSQARQQVKDLDERVRARAQLLETDVRGRYLRIQTAYEAIPVQWSNVLAAREQLKLAQDRYRLGSGNALEIADAQNGVQAAEGDYINAIFAYHQAIVALEAAVGHSLR